MAENRQALASQKKLQDAERQRLALEARRAGSGYAAIARQLGYRDPSGAYRAVQAGLHKALREPADDVRLMELDRLDRLQLAHWSRAVGTNETAPDLGAANYVLKLMDRRARLLGLDAPLRIDLRALVLEIAQRHDLTDDESRVLFDDLTGFLDHQRSGL